MGRKVFVGGLPWATDENALKDAFKEFGTVTYAKVISDRETGRSRGFGFVEFSSDAEAQAAVRGMDQQDLGGRKVTVNEAQDRRNDRGGGEGGGERRGPPRDRGAKDGLRSRSSGPSPSPSNYRSSPEQPEFKPDDGQGGMKPPRRQGKSRRRPADRWDNDNF